MSVWDTLGITPTSDQDEIRRAYVRQLRQHRPERDPEGYQRVREAWEEAKRYAALWHDRGSSGNEGSIAAVSPHGLASVDNYGIPSPSTEDASRLIDRVDSQAGSPDWSSIAHDTASEGDEPVRLLWSEPLYSLEDIQILAARAVGSELKGIAEVEKQWQRIASTGSLIQQQQFHQHLALALAENPELTDERLMMLSHRLGWGVENVNSGGVLPVNIVDRLYATVRQNEVEGAWQALLRKAGDGWRMKQLVMLIAGNTVHMPLWIGLVPNLATDLKKQVADLCTGYPELTARINPAVLRFSEETQLSLSWCGLFLLLFWGLVLNRSVVAAHPDGLLTTAAGGLLLYYLYAHDAIYLKLLRDRPLLLGGWMVTECLFSTLLIAGGVGLIHVNALNSINNGSVIMTLVELLTVLLLVGGVCRIRSRGAPFLRWPGQLIAGLLVSPWKIAQAVEFNLLIRAIIIFGLYMFCCAMLYDVFNAVK